MVEEEIEAHSGLDHPHILSFYATFQDRDVIALVLEWAPQGDLLANMSRIPRDEHVISRLVATPLLTCLASLHAMGMAHRDIKPENIFVRGSTVLLGDMGFCRATDRRPLVSCVGTVQFMAPEIVLSCCIDGEWGRTRRKESRQPYTCAVDIWALGVLLYEMLTRELPFSGDDNEEVCRKIIHPEPSLLASSLASLTPECRDFLTLMLTPDPARRPSAAELLDHPFVTNHISARTLGRLLRQSRLPQKTGEGPLQMPERSQRDEAGAQISGREEYVVSKSETSNAGLQRPGDMRASVGAGYATDASVATDTSMSSGVSSGLRLFNRSRAGTGFGAEGAQVHAESVTQPAPRAAQRGWWSFARKNSTMMGGSMASSFDQPPPSIYNVQSNAGSDRSKPAIGKPPRSASDHAPGRTGARVVPEKHPKGSPGSGSNTPARSCASGAAEGYPSAGSGAKPGLFARCFGCGA